MTPSKTPPKRWKRILVLQLVLWPVLLLLAEVGVRLAAGYDSDQVHEELSQIIVRMNSGVPDPGRNTAVEELAVSDLALHPYTGFAPRGLLSLHNHELDEARSEAPEGEYRIMILGGSVAGGFGNSESEGVGQVRELLLGDPRFAGRTIRILPQGFGSFKQPQQLDLANFLFAWGVVPHAVINLDGFNEVALTLQNASSGINPTYPSFARWAHLSTNWGSDTNVMLEALEAIRAPHVNAVKLASTAERLYLYRSALLGPLVLKGLRGFQWRHANASKDYERLLKRLPSQGPLAGPKFESDEASVLRDAVRMWSESSRSLRALCEERGIFYLNVLQPTLHDVGAKVPTPEELAKGQASEAWRRGAIAGYPLLREAGAKLRDEHGVHFVDGSGAFKDVNRTLYIDACHFNQLGNQILGRLVGEAFLRELPAGDLPR